MKKLWLPVISVAVLVGVYLYHRPVPAATALINVPQAPKTIAVDLPWPAAAQSALAAQGYGLLSSHNAQTPQPIASIAKVITALAILQKKPITDGEGPTITLTDNDVSLFNKYYSQDGSVAKVAAGEKITEYQALQAMLLPSANNIADTMAAWAFGSADNYVSYANKMVGNMGLTQTSVGGASGFDDKTLSTASDLVRLGLAAINDPSIASIIKQPSASLPVAGTVNNVNWLLGTDGVFGIKTGNTDKAGGCYLVAAKRQVAGQEISIVGAVLGAPELKDAISAADDLVKASDSGFKRVTAVHKGQKLDSFLTPWGARSDVLAAQDINLLAWQGLDIKILNGPAELKAPAAAGQDSGSITVNNGEKSVSGRLVLSQALPGPSWHWRLIRH
jgi:D-alanyl-D-alanine carboxypeptidase (penicillin-binding protein 5/6)